MKRCWHCSRPQGPWYVYVQKMGSAFWDPVFSGTKQQCEIHLSALRLKWRRARNPTGIADARVMR